MVDFEEMASKAKKAAEAQAAAEAKKAMEEESDRVRRMKAGEAALKRTALPLLQKAKKAFEKSGVPCSIDTEFDVSKSTSRKPQIIFRCAGPTKTNRQGGKSEPRSTSVFVESDGTMIDIGIGDYVDATYPQRSFGSSDEENAEDLITAALEIALDSYYAELAHLRQMGLWDD